MAGYKALSEYILQQLNGGHSPGSNQYVPGLGFVCNRAAAADPQNVWQNIFTIAGGRVIITALFGLRTVIQAGGASTMQFRWDDGVTPTVLDAGTLAVTAHAVGTQYVLTGDTTDPITAGATATPAMLGRVVATSTTYGALGLFIVTAGTIDVTMTAAAGTGSTGYTLCYLPLDTAVTVVAA